MPLTKHVLALLGQAGDSPGLVYPRLVVGVSGGPDSLALLHALKGMYPPADLIVAHVHHGLRPSADAEAQFVVDTAAAWGLACHVVRIDVAGIARREGLSLEEAGRQVRYRFFARLAGEVAAPAVAVAHHADDQAETVLLHLLRGTGLDGLRGMQPVSPLPGAPGLLLLRPLLEVSRDEIETYCRQRHLEPLEDSSNQDMTFLRNRLRRELLPLLATYNPQIKTHLQQMAAVVAADVALLDQWLQEHWPAILVESGPGWLSLDRAAWRLLPLSLRRRSLRRALAQLWPALPAELSLPGGPSLPDIAFRPIEQARTVGEQGRVGAQAALPGGLLFTVGYDHLTIAAGQALPPLNQPQLLVATPLPLPVPGRVALAGSWSIEATLLPEIDLQQIEQNQDPWLAFVDIGAAGASPLQLRPRRPGERFQPLGLQGQSASLKEVMINRQIPAALRARWPLVTMPEHVVWLVGHHIDERVRVTAASRRVIQLRCWADQINVY